MSYIVYVHVNKANGKVYVGQTRLKPNERWRNGKGYINNNHFYRSIQKYGWDNFEHKILYDNLTKEEANKIEMNLISFYDSTNCNKGYNQTIGGDGTNGYIYTDEQRSAISERQKGRLLTDEWKENIGKAVRGKNHPFYGKKLTDEHRKHLSESHIGLPSHGGMCGQKHTEEAKRKISESNMGRVVSEETRKKISKANSKSVRCVETGVVYSGLPEASEKTRCDKTGICLCCNGKQKTCGGYHWEYI